MPETKSLYSTNKGYKRQDIRDARKWFKEKIRELDSMKNLRGNMSDLRMRSRPGDALGRMVYFKYLPKHKDTLPYYDLFPLVIILDETKDSYLGLNLHYLPPKARALFLERLFPVINNTKFDRTTRLRITYPLLAAATKYRFFRPCIKRYLKGYMRSTMQYVRPEQWHKAIMLPAQDFRKASDSRVWQDSKLIWSKA